MTLATALRHVLVFSQRLDQGQTFASVTLVTEITAFAIDQIGMYRREWPRNREIPMPILAGGIAVLTIVCLVFYLYLRPEADRNYGGVSCGFRWMFWCTPLWLFAMLPTLDRIAHSLVWRRVAYVCLAVSVFSAAYPSANPWQHPWPYQIAQYLGLV